MKTFNLHPIQLRDLDSIDAVLTKLNYYDCNLEKSDWLELVSTLRQRLVSVYEDEIANLESQISDLINELDGVK